MDVEIFREYLVSLGFNVNHSQLRQFEDSIRSAGMMVERITTGMVKQSVIVGTAFVGALTGIATAAAAIVSNIADADLSFQIFARRMFLNADAARHMKIALDALGVSAEDVIWGPPELAQRYRALDQMQSRIEREFGGTQEVEKRLRQFRDLEFRFTEMRVALGQLARYGSMRLIERLFGDGKAQDQLERWLDNLITNIPKLADDLASTLAPILKNVYEIWKDIVVIGKDATSVFLQFTGALYGDRQLEKGEVSLKNIGRALEHISDTVRAIADSVRWLADLITQHPVLSRMFMGAAGGAVLGSFFPGVGTGVGAVLGGAFGAGTAAGSAIVNSLPVPGAGPAAGIASSTSIPQMIANVAKAMGIDPAIAEALVKRESGFNQGARGSKGEVGLFQLMPGTARQLGVDPTDVGQNIRGGLTYLQQMFMHYGDWTRALEAYNAGPRAVDTGRIPYSSQEYAASILAQAQSFRSQGSTINVGGVTVNISQPNATPDQIKDATISALDEKLGRRTQSNLLQLSGPYA